MLKSSCSPVLAVPGPGVPGPEVSGPELGSAAGSFLIGLWGVCLLWLAGRGCPRQRRPMS